MADLDTDLIGHWPLADDTDDHSSVGHRTNVVDVELGAAGPSGKPGKAAEFNGETSFLEVADHPAFRFGTGDLALTAWVYPDEQNPDVVGNLVSKFDPGTRRGLQLYILTSSGVTSTAQPNRRSLQFGIDNARLAPEWTDCGRPGNAVKIGALAVCGGQLYAGTLETGPDEMGRLWRYEGGDNWIDLGNPMGCNAIQSVIEFNDAVYCGFGRYNCTGSALGKTLNQTPGGKVYRVEPGGQWVCCGHPGAEDATTEKAHSAALYESGKADEAFGFIVYRGELYCTSNHRRGAFRYGGGENWTYIGPDERILSFTIYRGKLHALTNGGPVYRYEGGTDWSYCGLPGTSTQTYSAVICAGRLYVGTWPDGAVFRYEGGETWAPVSDMKDLKETDPGATGTVGFEREIMAMVLYNGKAYLGSLPMANVWRLDGGRFTFLNTLDHSSAPLRRVWSMAVHDGKLFAGTLPSGHVHCVEAGKMATWDRVFPNGWHHVAAVKERGGLRLFVDGKQVAASTAFPPADYDLSNDRPLCIGFGAYDYLRGRMSDVRLYNRALSPGEVGQLAGS